MIVLRTVYKNFFSTSSKLVYCPFTKLSSNSNTTLFYTCSFKYGLLNKAPTLYNRNYSLDNTSPPEKKSLFTKMKEMYRDYWYVLVPVHLVTSTVWLGSFYYLSKSGVDIIAIMKSVGISEKFTDPLKDSSMGHIAIAYALYKIATPARYTVTLGGTTISIKYLQNWGYIKPIPSREKLKEMYQVKKEGLQEMYQTKREGLQEIYQETKQELKNKKIQIKEKKDNVLEDLAKYKDIKNIKKGELKK